MPAAPSVLTQFLVIAFDYLVPFLVIGCGAMFRGKIKADPAAISLGIGVTYTIRFLCHVFTGNIVWGSAWVASLVYNIGYMLPETVIAVAVALISYPLIKRLWAYQL